MLFQHSEFEFFTPAANLRAVHPSNRNSQAFARWLRADERIGELQNAFGLPTAQLGVAGTELNKARILKAVDAKHPEKIHVRVEGSLAPRLEPDDHLLWTFASARFLTIRSRLRRGLQKRPQPRQQL